MSFIKGFFRGRTSIQPIWVFVIALFIFFSFMSEYFLSFGNITNILVQTSTIGLVALGMTFVMINGNIDLSVGAILGLAASLAVGLQEVSMTLAILAALGSGILLGALNGFVVWKTGVNAFIVTLGAMLGVRGLIFLYTDEQSFFAMNFAFADFGTSTIGPFPVLAIIFLACALIMHLVLTRTGHGRNTFAVGGNPEASIDAGIRLGRHMMINFIIVGFFAALAGVLLASQMGAATPNLGRDYELWVITAVVLGGTKLTGGYGSIVGTLGGVLAIGILRNGMNLMQVPAFYVLVILGAILISVLIIDKKLNAPSAKEVRI
ncbi:ABC transporter permease [Halomonas sp. XH26]|uniref:ABC transporter permease n=1 Tax=Vreelandella alkaliphila TaxID=272774 RepID=A0AAJ2S0E1_9GAMM|nr:MULTISPECIES: ABC transporter permease [Halomonas]AIA74080.1 ribose ABC transporter [Halomonas campaniensis]MCD6005313.1 ABC transporter permease [Halomonas sp. IOP_6]MCD6439408.1 ABC transporter permease [Halomonas sp.]MDX5977581.1 ABC transporter permease [Halomonas alkaliphila]UTA79543.1 ABC transporter permease [Halomonas sp. XH26]